MEPTIAQRVRYREAARRDTPALASLWREMMDFHYEVDSRFRFGPGIERDLERHLLQTIRSRDAQIVVAEVDGNLVGYIAGEIHMRRPVYPSGTYGFVSDISVTAPHRRQGIGAGLVHRLMEWFRSRGITSVELFVATANPVSSEFWRAVGFGDYLRLLRKELPPEATE